MLDQLGLGNGRKALEILQVGGGNELIEVLQTDLVLCDQNDVLREARAAAPVGTELEHLFVDALNARHAALLQHGEEPGEHLRDRHGVVARAMVVERGQLQMLRDDVQLVILQPRQQVLRKDQRIQIGRLEGNAALFAALADKADIEFCIVRGKDPAAREIEERAQRVLQLRRADEHRVGDAGQADDLRRQPPLRIDKRLERIHDLAVAQQHRADLRDRLLRDLQSGRFNIEADDLVGKSAVLRAVDADAVVQIVYIISFAAV